MSATILGKPGTSDKIPNVDQPPYVFMAVNKDFKEFQSEVHRLFVLIDYPDEAKLKELQAGVDEDRSVLSETCIIPATPEVCEEFREIIIAMYMRSMN